MAKLVIRISELEAARRFTALVARLRAGDEIVIEDGTRPVAIIHATEMRRTISESIAWPRLTLRNRGMNPYWIAFRRRS